MSELRDRVAERLLDLYSGPPVEGTTRLGFVSDDAERSFLRIADEVLRIVAWNRARGNKPTTLPPEDWRP